MYRAKALGRACHQVFDTALHAEAMARLEMESDLRRALERSEFVVAYQPVASAATGQVCRVQASLAWRHPRRGLVGWEEFAPPAEHTGLIVPIGAWLLRKAVKDVTAARAAGLAVGLAVRLSPRQFRHEELAHVLDGILEQSGLPADLLDLEVAESTLMENVAASVTILNTLKQRGVELSIVEFGRGYSSLNSLRHLPVDALTMDPSFMDNLPSNPSDASLVIAMIALGHSLGLRVAAVGVETATQLDFLRSHGCDEAQGSLIGPPAPVLPAPVSPARP
jgi:EAL domain-containing protein (putative c-di-GMP-specific phosphodiesterase class I)